MTEHTVSPFTRLSDSRDYITIARHNWSSQIVMGHVIGSILEQSGSRVTYLTTDANAVYDKLVAGEVVIEPEVWEGVFHNLFTAAMKTGGVVDAGSHAAITREDWWYPDFVEVTCPGLPDWRALNTNADKFASPSSGGRGVFLAGPENWPQHHEEKIKALGLNFIVVHAESAEALWAAIDTAKNRGSAIVMQNWTPNFVEAIHAGKFVEFPVHDHDAPKNGYLKKAAWSGMQEKWPRAFGILNRVSFSNAQIAEMAKLVDVDGMLPADAAMAWRVANETIWQPWVE